MYLDSAYIAKYYVNERDSMAVRSLIREAHCISSSSWASVEVVAIFQRHVREGHLTATQGQTLTELFREHVEAQHWTLIPITNRLLRKTSQLFQELPSDLSLCAGDAIHLATVLDSGEAEIWTSDRRLLAAAAHFGLTGKTARDSEFTAAENRSRKEAMELIRKNRGLFPMGYSFRREDAYANDDGE